MAKNRFGKSKKKAKGHRKSPKRVAAGRKAARTRKRHGVMKRVHRSGAMIRKSAKRVAAGKRLFAKMAARYGGVAKYKAILRARLARARRAR